MSNTKSNSTKWRVEFQTIGDIILRESFSICDIDFDVKDDRKFIATMNLDVSKNDMTMADELAYEKITIILTTIALIGNGNIAIKKGTLCSTPITEDTITYEIDANGETIKVINFNAVARMGLRCEVSMSKILSLSEDMIRRVENIISLSKENKNASLILTLLRIDNPFSGSNLFKIFELIRNDYGSSNMKELEPAMENFTISRFTSSLDKPHGVGIEHSRHSISKNPIDNPMNIHQCKVFLLVLLDNWINARVTTS